MCIQTHSKNMLMQQNIQHRLPFTNHRMMNDRCEYGKFSRMERPKTEWDFIMSRTSMFSKGKLGRALGVIQTGSQSQRNPNAPTFEERPIEWTLSMEEKQGTQLKFLHKSVYKVPGSYSENRNRFFKPSPASNVFFTLSNYIERKRIQWTRRA